MSNENNDNNNIEFDNVRVVGSEDDISNTLNENVVWSFDPSSKAFAFLVY